MLRISITIWNPHFICKSNEGPVVIKIDSETAFLCHLVSDLYQHPTIQRPSLDTLNVNKLLQISIKNKLGFYTSKTLIDTYNKQLTNTKSKFLKNFYFSCKNQIEKLRKTTINLTKCLNDYAIIKTFRGYPVLPNDIDVLVPRLDIALKKLSALGISIIDVNDHQIMVLLNGQKVHLHNKVSWADSTFLDEALIRSHPRFVELWDVSVKIPNATADFLIYMAHANFEPLHFTLSDFIYLCKIASSVKWTLVLSQAKKYNWIRTLTQSLFLLDAFHHALYSDSCPFEQLQIPHPKIHINSIFFPKSIPRWLIMNAFLEKKAFGYLIHKLSKSLDVLVTGDTYNKFYVPPEQVHI